MEFKTRLQQLLDAKDGGNMTPLALYCEISPQAVQQWIAKGRLPRPARVKQVAQYFGMGEQEFSYGESVPASFIRAPASKSGAANEGGNFENVSPEDIAKLVLLYGSATREGRELIMDSAAAANEIPTGGVVKSSGDKS